MDFPAAVALSRGTSILIAKSIAAGAIGNQKPCLHALSHVNSSQAFHQVGFTAPLSPREFQTATL
jgi:hypothetical protein